MQQETEILSKLYEITVGNFGPEILFYLGSLGRLTVALAIAFVLVSLVRHIVLPVLAFISSPFLKALGKTQPIERMQRLSLKGVSVVGRNKEKQQTPLLPVILRNLNAFLKRMRDPLFIMLSQLGYVFVLLVTEPSISRENTLVISFLAVLRSLLLVVIVSKFLLTATRIVEDLIDEDKEIESIYPMVLMQIARGLIYFAALIVLFATVSGRSPWGILTALSALSALAFLLFRNQIISVLFSLQVHASKLFKPGDIFQLKSIDTEGVIEQMSLFSIQVRNWDNSLSYIPTSMLEGASFKNLTSFSKNGMRRSIASIFIDPSSVRLLRPADRKKSTIGRFARAYAAETKTLSLVSDKSNKNKAKEKKITGLGQTNLAAFRQALVEFLYTHPGINQKALRMVSVSSNAMAIEIKILFFVVKPDIVVQRRIEADLVEYGIALLKDFDLRAGKTLIN